jgi:hypothetical protein
MARIVFYLLTIHLKNMKRSAIIIGLVFCTTLSAQKEKSYASHWRENINNDMKSQITEFKYSEKGKFYYYFSNDRDNIYVDLRIFDKSIQNQVLRSGLTVWINTEGKSAKKTGIKYPVGRQNNGGPGMQERKNIPQGRQAPSGNREMPELPVNTLELIGFSKSGPVTVSTFENDNFRGSVKFEKDGMWYELIMPLNKLPEITAKDKDGARAIILGFGYTGAPASAGQGGTPAGGQGGAPSGGGPGGGGGGQRGGGGAPGGARQGGAPSGGSGPGPSSGIPVLIWIKHIRLAAEK